MDPQKALIGELTTQLNEAIQARTNMGVSFRLMEARLLEAEAKVKEMETRKARPAE